MLAGKDRTEFVVREIAGESRRSTQRFASARAACRRLIPGIICASAGVLFCGCASYPISQSLREEAKPVSSERVVSAPSSYIGTVVIWGGRVLTTVNDTNGATIYVLKLPLDHCERPKADKIYTGRFIIQTSSFVDPELFRGEKLITVAGEITGVKTEPFQKMHYTYPVLAIKELRIWRIGHWYPGFWGWYGPGWGWYGDAYNPYWDGQADWNY